MREHIGLVASSERIEQERSPIRHYARRVEVSFKQPVEPVAFTWHTFVTATQNGHAPPAGLERTRELLHNRRFAGAADRQIADTNDQAAKRALPKDSLSIKIQSQVHQPLLNERHPVENTAQHPGACAVTPLQNDVDGKLLEIFPPTRHYELRLDNRRLRTATIRAPR